MHDAKFPPDLPVGVTGRNRHHPPGQPRSDKRQSAPLDERPERERERQIQPQWRTDQCEPRDAVRRVDREGDGPEPPIEFAAMFAVRSPRASRTSLRKRPASSSMSTAV